MSLEISLAVLDQAMAVRRHGVPMMMVMTVMAVALHLIQTIKEVAARCQIFRLPPGGVEAENGAVRARKQLTALAVAALGVCLAGTAQYQDRDTRGVPKTSSTAPPPDARLDINHASVEELLKVPGMTRSWAGRIVRFRPYRTKQDLVENGVVTSQVYDRIKDYVIAHRDPQ
ncbi:MAG: helix-hairpin-helix domain-containing protein [Terracidiphilus sp.]